MKLITFFDFKRALKEKKIKWEERVTGLKSDVPVILWVGLRSRWMVEILDAS